MTRSPVFAAIAAMGLLAGCGQPAADNTAATATPDTTLADRIAALSEVDRKATLFRAIRDAGRDCQQVTSASAAGSVQGVPAWLATCDNGGQWLVAIGPDGIATVTNAAELRAAQGN